jgi:probable F420-dependent oxidoreductase
VTRPFRFALAAPSVVGSRQTLVDHVRFAEAAGYSVATFPDHFFLPLSPVVAMAVAAEATRRLRVGTLMLAATFRHPAVFAKEAATLDLLSEGRLELGVGSGWMEDEHRATGLPFGGPGERIDRLAEVLDILRVAWAGDRLSYDGRFFQLSDVPSLPRPVQPGGPPILVGGGMRRILSLAARKADVVSIASGAISMAAQSRSADQADALVERVGWVRAAAAEAGTDPELHILVSNVAICTDRTKGARRCLAESRPGSGDDAAAIEALLSSPFSAIGTPDQIAEKLRELRATLGISYFGVRETAGRAFAAVVEELAGT